MGIAQYLPVLGSNSNKVDR